ncbi:acyl-CoA dehydrogenase family protein [Microbacterium sp. 18062]|uniref:acyl-CoA dehydrogenase family protein n=1 Tax=Microbacterium sp. 18062 TaxID=2681410 RepID=UPI00135C3903|nr:acyl-CoA dehydrogenase family protein [Microbacterium sp. 18062]
MTTADTTATARTHWSGTADRAETDRWDAVATEVAETLGVDALARDRANAQPFAEATLLKDSGLATLLDPAELGGGGAHWESAFRAVRILSRTDASIGQLLGYHYINEANVALVAPAEERERWFRATVDGRWIWGDSVNPVDPNLTLSVDGDGYRLNGFKRYSTGSGVGDALLINAVVDGGEHHGEFAFLVLPYGHPGVELVDDWDNLGQRLSASNTVTYRDVRVEPEHVLGFGTDEPIQSIITPGIQLVFGNLYLGLAQGALAQARELTNARPNSWFLSGVPTYSDDPFVRRLYGELVSRVAAVEALADRVNRRFDEVVGDGWAVTADDRAALEIEIAQLKVVSSDTAVDVANRVFEATGTSSTANRVGLDLHWRNIRTHSLHDPVDYKKLEVGANFLTGVVQPISLYT